jgi:lipopolysaccharide/colanic/teichoic acid biosynthesis glycosyltransferase
VNTLHRGDGTDARDPVAGRENQSLKRIFDIVASAAFLIALSPIMALIAAAMIGEGAVDPKARGPLFYRQRRVSAGRDFMLVKFRTFRPGPDQAGLSEEDLAWRINELPLTRVGWFLRRCYFDELPQLWNILKGEMGFVGPRPWPRREYERRLAQGHHAKRLLKGGVCGPVQAAKGRSVPGTDDMLLAEYSRRSALGVLALDLRLIAKTLGVVLRAKGL